MCKISIWLCVALAVVAGFGGVALADEEPGGAPAADKPAFNKIVFRDTGGFSGRGSGRNLTIGSDGALSAPAKGKLTAEQLAEVNKRVAAVDWKGMKPRYAIPGAADLFVIQLQATVGGKTYSTSVDDLLLTPDHGMGKADPQPPKPLVELLQYLDQTWKQQKGEKKM
jgi:hypothetical protein